MKKIVSGLLKGPLAALFMAAVFALTFTLAACDEGGGEIKKEDAVSGAGELFGEVTTEPTPAVAPAEQPDLTKLGQDLMAQATAETAALNQKIAELQAKLEEQKNASAAELAAWKAEVADAEAKKAVIEASSKSLDEAKDKNDDLKKDLEIASKDAAAKKAEYDKTTLAAGPAVKKIDLTIMTGQAYDDAYTEGADVEFTFGNHKPIPQSVSSKEGEMYSVSFESSADDPFTVADAINFKICSKSDDQWMIAAIKVTATTESGSAIVYMNPSVWVVLNESCEDFNILKDEAFVYQNRTEDNGFWDWNSGTDDAVSVRYNFTADADRKAELINALNARYKKGDITKCVMSSKFNEVVCMVDSQGDNFTHDQKNAFGMTLPIGDIFGGEAKVKHACGEGWYDDIAGTGIDFDWGWGCDDWISDWHKVWAFNIYKAILNSGDECSYINMDGSESNYGSSYGYKALAPDDSCSKISSVGDGTSAETDKNFAPVGWFDELKNNSMPEDIKTYLTELKDQAAKIVAPAEGEAAPQPVVDVDANTVIVELNAYINGGKVGETDIVGVYALAEAAKTSHAAIDAKKTEVTEAMDSTSDKACLTNKVGQLDKRSFDATIHENACLTAAYEADNAFIEARLALYKSAEADLTASKTTVIEKHTVAQTESEFVANLADFTNSPLTCDAPQPAAGEGATAPAGGTTPGAAPAAK